jgi:cobalamin biosynthesis Mg chelatase CobN
MIGMRHRSRTPGRSFVLLLSVLALAFVCLPAAAGADSSGIQYEDAPPTATGEQPTSRDQTPARSSDVNGGATAPSGQGGGGSGSSGGSSSDPSSRDGGGGLAAAGKNDGGNGKGSQGLAGGGQLHPAKKLSQATETTTEEKGDGGSSPLVPILIAIAVLAAISIGALLYRQRRQRGGSLSPEAG